MLWSCADLGWEMTDLVEDVLVPVMEGASADRGHACEKAN
jgi:hypothetical protein